MLFGQDRDQLRRLYFEAWQAHQEGLPLEPLQAEIVAVVKLHPEYHALLESPERAIDKDYSPELGETNPFLHMGMHLAIHEQVSTDRPAGIRALYQQLLAKQKDAHSLEHALMDCLADMIWQAQREGRQPDEAAYLTCIQTLAERS